MGNTDLLNNLKIEIEDSRNGVGKTPDSVKNTCIYLDEALSKIEDACNILEVENVKVSNLKILPEDSTLFKKLISDLHDKGIILHLNEYIDQISMKIEGHVHDRRNVTQDTYEPREMEEGQNIVIKNINEFREYRSYIKGIINSLEALEVSKQLEKMTVFFQNREITYKNQNINEDVVETEIINKNIKKDVIDKNAILLYGGTIQISNQKIYYKNINSDKTELNIEPAGIRILKYLIERGRGNSDNWSTKKEIADSLNIAFETVSNCFTDIRKVFKITKIELFEEKGKAKDGKFFRINHKIL